MAVLFPDNELEVMDYNRAVKDLNGLNKDTFLKTISFQVYHNRRL